MFWEPLEMPGWLWRGRGAQGGRVKVTSRGRGRQQRAAMSQRGGKRSAGTSRLGRALVSHRKHQGPVLVFSFLSTHSRVRSWWLPHTWIDQISRKQSDYFCKAFAFSSCCRYFSFGHLGQGPRCPNWDNLLCGHAVCAGEIRYCHEDFSHPYSLGCSR